MIASCTPAYPSPSKWTVSCVPDKYSSIQFAIYKFINDYAGRKQRDWAYTGAHHSQRFPGKFVEVVWEEEVQTSLLFAVVECLADSGDE